MIQAYRPNRPAASSGDLGRGAVANASIASSGARLRPGGRLPQETEVCVAPDSAGARVFADYGKRQLCGIQEDGFLLKIAAGLRASLVVEVSLPLRRVSLHAPDELPEDLLDMMTSAALEAYQRGVNDRVVELMAERESATFAWFFLNVEGEIESASATAAAFCELHLSGEPTLPPAGMAYIWEAARELRSRPETHRERPVVFAIPAAGGLAHCLLRAVGESGFLLSICLDWQ